MKKKGMVKEKRGPRENRIKGYGTKQLPFEEATRKDKA